MSLSKRFLFVEHLSLFFFPPRCKQPPFDSINYSIRGSKISKKFPDRLKARVKNSRRFRNEYARCTEGLKRAQQIRLEITSASRSGPNGIWFRDEIRECRWRFETLWRRSTGGGIDPRGSPLPHLDTGPTSKSTPALPFRPSRHASSHDRRALPRTPFCKIDHRKYSGRAPTWRWRISPTRW